MSFWDTHAYHNSLVLKWGVTWRYTLIIVDCIAIFPIVIMKNRGCNNDIQCTSVYSPNWLLLHFQVLWSSLWIMFVAFWHDNWETCAIPIPKIVYVYLKPFSYSGLTKITKHCSYLHSSAHFGGFHVFPSTKNIFNRWSCVTYQKNSPTRGYTLWKKRNDMIKIAPSEAIYNGSETPCTYVLWCYVCLWEIKIEKWNAEEEVFEVVKNYNTT